MDDKRATHIIDGGEVHSEPDQEIIGFGADALAQVALTAASRVESIKKIKNAAIRFTNHHDWVVFGSGEKARPFPTASACEKMAMVGLSVSDISYEKQWDEDDDGRYYIYAYTGVFSITGSDRRLAAVGTCSSRDQFFAKASGELKPLSDIDQTNIMKAAYSNLLVNGFTRLLGMRNLTFEDLEAAGIERKDLEEVTFKEGSQGGVATDDRAGQDEAWEICLEMAYGGQDEAANLLETATEFETKEGKKVKGLRRYRYLKGQRLEITLRELKAAIETFRKNQPENQNQDQGNLPPLDESQQG